MKFVVTRYWLPCLGIKYIQPPHGMLLIRALLLVSSNLTLEYCGGLFFLKKSSTREILDN